MIRLRLIKGLSHTNAYVSASQKNPIVTVETEEAAAACVAGGFFEIVGNDASVEPGKAQAEAASLDTFNHENEPDAAAPAVETPDISGTDEEDELESMTVAELRAYAETTGVALGKLTKKADIVAAIRKAEAE